MAKEMLCPVCNKHTFREWYEYCPVCNWCHSFLQEEFPDDKKYENIMSLNEAKEAYEKCEEIW